MVCVLLVPTVTLPKLMPEGMTEICDWTPVPLREMFNGEFVALLVTVTVPTSAPAALGANFTLNGVDCPGARVSGRPAAVSV